ncbi:hypothetical protein [Sinobaca sp. H24]|uniref:hypothetical protein n=1 Tax=Sinobaca sp. H24 TaxID=2923376 RepID=UPI0020797E24|nr:hypothetical protein [Sinobaca sp. H24]
MISAQLEKCVRKALHCREGNTYGGIVTAQSIEGRGGIFTAASISLAHYYRVGSEASKKKIEDILNKASFFQENPLEENPELAEEILNEIKLMQEEIFIDRFQVD